MKTEYIRKAYPAGSRVKLISISDPWTSLKPGVEGTVLFVDDIGTVHVDWDNGSSLGLIPGEDQFRKIKEDYHDEH